MLYFLTVKKLKVKLTKAFAIVKKDKPTIKVQDIYKDKDVRLNKGEKFVPVVIMSVSAYEELFYKHSRS